MAAPMMSEISSQERARDTEEREKLTTGPVRIEQAIARQADAAR